MPSRVRRPARSGRMPKPDYDYEAGHRAYVSRLDEAARRWLLTKPFSAPPRADLAHELHTFAHLVSQVELPLRAQVLDVGCGPGWVSEFLARCGHWVTGVDVSDEMLAVARTRIAAVPRPLGEVDEPLADFVALDAAELPWRHRFDAAVLYDALHHIADAEGALRAIHRALVPGGVLFVHEGIRPPPGSPAERQILAEAEEFQTLESWFEPSYLARLLREAGFAPVTRFFALDGLYDVARARPFLRAALRYLVARARLRPPPTNTLLAVKPAPWVGQSPGWFEARFEPLGAARVRVVNAGRSYWPESGAYPYVPGAVTVAPFVREDGLRVELPRIELERGVSPGEAVEVEVPDHQGRVALDVVREGIGWFSELGGR